MRKELAVALSVGALLAWPALASSSSHGSGGGGGHSSGGGGGHSSSGGHSSGGHSSGGSSHGSSSHGSSSHASGSPSYSGSAGAVPRGSVPQGAYGAGLRHPRPGTGHGFYGGGYYGYPYSGYYGYPYSYSPFFGFGFGYPFYDDFYGGYGYGYPYAYGYGYGYPGYGYGYPNNDYYGGGNGNDNGNGNRGGGYSSERRGVGYFRIMVDPTDAEVYVDDKLVGTVDDFNGYSHHLAVRAGEHVITFQRDGYKTHRIQVFVRPGSIQKVRYDMVKGAGEDPGDVMTQGQPPARENERDGDRDVQVAPSSTSGALELDVQPQDATVYVDGEFKGIGREAGNLELPEGRHRVEVVRPGFKTFTTEIDISSDRPAQLSIELERP